ncbi:transposase domain-containing protein [Escherichia coli]|uniref:transposase domain-containing protein n=1 Tax=Escherichia coli TaxID=562 RepID=UPI0011BDBDD0
MASVSISCPSCSATDGVVRNGTCKLNGVEPESYLRYVLDVIADWPINRVGELLPWRVALPTE